MTSNEKKNSYSQFETKKPESFQIQAFYFIRYFAAGKTDKRLELAQRHQSGLGCGFFQFIRLFDHHEKHEGDDQKIDRVL